MNISNITIYKTRILRSESTYISVERLPLVA